MTLDSLPVWANYPLQFLVSMIATMSFGISFQVPRRHHLACGVVGAVGWLVYVLAQAAGLTAPAATLLAALPLTAFARLFAITHKAPVTLFLLCGIFPLVPGAGIYYTAYYFLRNDQRLFTNKGFETLKVAVALALGIALVCSLPLPRSISRQQYNGPRHN
ncbi:MAG: threonine/serine exporter family protein [Gemmiger sp.]|uniref:threonine/serine exporter family protein n=1 Tax=Gemmiger sp. TaxID=2049027 RepID=UPI002E759F8F|nr:threonine/serine exporter family protein [Gemmiger sp.]MEE0799804.1 threonine/serine exporter family protein [Gemmiger sp.]